MIQLDYRTYNRRWGLTGLVFSSWEEYGKTLGFLANPEHHRKLAKLQTKWSNAMLLYVEANDQQGADAIEYRASYYKKLSDLRKELPDYANSATAGVGNVVARMNSNGYIESLVTDYGFQIVPRVGQLTQDIRPNNDLLYIKNVLQNFLLSNNMNTNQVTIVMQNFDAGYNL